MKAHECRTRYHTSMLALATPRGGVAEAPQTLFQAVQAALEKFNTTFLRPVAESFSNLGCQPRFMLGLLTYCYARQIYGSGEIARILAADAPLASACQQRCPSADMIRRFRDQNRQAIRTCLTRVLSFLARQKVDAGMVTKVDEGRLAEEARRRLIMAMCEDTREPAGAVNA